MKNNKEKYDLIDKTQLNLLIANFNKIIGRK